MKASFRKTKKPQAMSPFLKYIFYCLYLLGTLQHVWKLSVTSFCNMFLIKLNKTIPIIDI